MTSAPIERDAQRTHRTLEAEHARDLAVHYQIQARHHAQWARIEYLEGERSSMTYARVHQREAARSYALAGLYRDQLCALLRGMP